MATIKLQPSGAVVIKDGKVSCSCCECVTIIETLKAIGSPPIKPTSLTWNLTWPFGSFDPEIDGWDSTGTITTADGEGAFTGGAFKCRSPEDPELCPNFSFLNFGLVFTGQEYAPAGGGLKCRFYIFYVYQQSYPIQAVGEDTLGPFTTEELLTSHTIEFLGYTATLTISPIF
jgi:hypothetical protein